MKYNQEMTNFPFKVDIYYTVKKYESIKESLEIHNSQNGCL